MKYLYNETQIGGAESADDAIPSTASLQLRLDDVEYKLSVLPPATPLDQRLQAILNCGYLLLDLDRKEEAWQRAKDVFDQAVPETLWLRAVEACDILYKAEQPDSLKGLTHGIWLGVTYPIDPELSVAMLQHLVEETPDHSDGAAVAAATAGYLVDMRASGEQRDELRFFTMQLLGQVARRHSQVDDQETFNFWIERMELNDPDKFLPRLAQILNLLAGDNWWFDRDKLRDRLPEDKP